MRSSRTVGLQALLACLAIWTVPVGAQSDQATSITARHVTRRAGGQVDEAQGLLVADAKRKELRYETGQRMVFTIPFEQVIAIHEEPARWALVRGRSSYVTIHYAQPAGEASFEIVRVSRTDLPMALAAIERDTRLSVDRSPVRESFLGVPLHVAVGDTVVVTNDADRRRKGKVTQLSVSSINLQPAARFDATAVRRIDVSDSMWDGAAGAVPWPCPRRL